MPRQRQKSASVAYRPQTVTQRTVFLRILSKELLIQLVMTHARYVARHRESVKRKGIRRGFAGFRRVSCGSLGAGVFSAQLQVVALGTDFLDELHLILAGDQHRSFSLNDDDVVEPDRCDAARAGLYEATTA
jgi:hypothetical protein